MIDPNHRIQRAPPRDKARPLPPERRRTPGRQRPDRRLPIRKPEPLDRLPDDDGQDWSAAALVDPDFDEFTEDVDRLVGRSHDPYIDEDETWIGLRP